MTVRLRPPRKEAVPRRAPPKRLVPGCAAFLTLFCAWPASPAGQESPPGEPAGAPAEERVYLSLRVLAKRAESFQDWKFPFPAEVANLGGISWPEGYIIDAPNRDILLVGRRRGKRSPLHLDDLAVCIRNALSDDVHPHCSLDPCPEDVVKVREILSKGLKVFGKELLMARMRRAWGPQKVLVRGVPEDSRFAWVMVDADYHMKKVSQGLLDMTGVHSYLDRSLASMRKAVRAGEEISEWDLSYARFWFHLEKEAPTFLEGEGIVLLECCPVVLLTEKQMATADGRLVDVGGIDDRARDFAADFSRLLRSSATDVPVYEDL